jgi:uncharacterized protein (TIGR02246 family)
MTDDERAIRKLIADWHAATKSHDLDRILPMMADDIVFMVPGKKPFGKKEFAEGSRAMKDAAIESSTEFEELQVLGDWAFGRLHLTVTITPPGEKPMTRSGYVMSLYRKESDGRWVLARDANLLASSKE